MTISVDLADMHITARAILLAIVCTTFAVAPAAAQSVIQVVGLDNKPVTVALTGIERRTVVTQDRGLRAEFEGVALLDVLIKAGVPFELRGPAMARVVIASAPDGYRVAYAIAELDPGFTDQIVLIADRRDGKPLLPDTGPLQIIVPNDKRAGRWVRQVNKIEVRELK